MIPTPTAELPWVRALALEGLWRRPGGRGAGIGVIVIEQGGCVEHLAWRTRDVVVERALLPTPHATSVVGMLAAGDGGGLCPEASVRVWGTAVAGRHDPASVLRGLAVRPGDVVLVQLQGAADGASQVPADADPEVRRAIAALAQAGAVVVLPAGNGGHDLADVRVGGRCPWDEEDAGAVIVGALDAAGRSARSCRGDRVDIWAAGAGLVTPTTDRHGTLRSSWTWAFGGTSAAACVVAGLIACAQGMARARGAPPSRAEHLRARLRAASDLAAWIRTL